MDALFASSVEKKRLGMYNERYDKREEGICFFVLGVGRAVKVE